MHLGSSLRPGVIRFGGYVSDQAASTLKYVSLQSNTHNKVGAMVFDFSGTKIKIPGSYLIGKAKANNEAGYTCFWNVLPHESNEPILGTHFSKLLLQISILIREKLEWLIPKTL